MSRHAPFALAVLFSALLAAVSPALWPWVIGCLVVLGLAWLCTSAARAGSAHGFAGRGALVVLVMLVVLVAAGAAALTVLDGGGGGSSNVAPSRAACCLAGG